MIPELAAFDAVALIAILVSAVVGIARGFARELLSLVIWGLAVVATLAYGSRLAQALALESEALSTLFGYGLIFFGVLLIGALAQSSLGRMIKSLGLKGLDRSLGLAFGALRGIAVCVLITIALQPFFSDTDWWRAALTPPLANLLAAAVADLDETHAGAGRISLQVAP